jgi:Flp pilus assembly protein TadG
MLIRVKSQRRRGAAMVESSVGLVILLFVIFGIIEFAQLIMARQLMNIAAVTAGRVAAVGEQPATYPDGTATPSPGGSVSTAFLNTWISKSLAAAPLSNINPQYYGSNADNSPNTSIAWNATQFGNGFYININATYIPLFSGNRLYADNTGSVKPMVGAVNLNRTVFIRTEANN